MKHIESVAETVALEQLRDQGWAARLLDCSTKTLETWRTKGFGPRWVRVGRLVRYREADIHAWIESNVRRSTSEMAR
jgi:predicted DNA-binding transcriptional regulator AlpA